MISIAIIEDDKKAAEELQSILERFGQEEKEKFEITAFDSAVPFLTTYTKQFQLIFMDIDLPKLNGMDAVRKLREVDKDCMVIFVTSLAQYALKGYEVNAFDFILKPVNYYDFRLKMLRVMENLHEKYAQDKRIFINNRYVKTTLCASEILYVEVVKHSLLFHTVDKKVYTENKPMKWIQEELKGYPFALCNQCYLVNLKYVSQVENYNVYLGDISLLISHPRKKGFLSALNDYYLKGGAF